MTPERMQYPGRLALGRAFLLLVLAAGSCAQSAATQDDSIRAFHIKVPDEQLVDLRKRLATTRWPDRETVNDESQGIRLAETQALVHYWGTDYDWRKVEAKLNALPEFVTTIDGADIQFIHVRSRERNALPLILTHGWPGSPLEFLKVIGPLTDPVAYGSPAQDAFDVVIDAIPGYGFSGKPTDLGWNPDRVARAWDVLMKRLGYPRYVSQGGDHGSVISDALARQAPPGLLSIHLRPIRRSNTSMKSLRAVTSPPGSSRSFSPRNCERHSEHCANANQSKTNMIGDFSCRKSG